jgi:ketosteroid isomerase-like protein
MMSEESTSPDLVELARRSVEAFGVGDFDTTMSVFAADTVWDSVGLGTTFAGKDAIRSFLEEWRGRYASYAVEVQEIVDLGNGVLLVRSDQTGRPAGSPAHVRMPREIMVHVLVFDDGAVTRTVSSGDTPEARAAAERLAEERG